MKKFAIAIDGPAGSGKSTVAKILAKKLGIVYIDTGAMYRTVALSCIRKSIDTKSSGDVVSSLENLNIDIVTENGTQRIFLDGEDVTGKIRTQEVGQGASDVGLILEVRNKLADMQRQMAKETSVIMDGRDIGTVILPHAEVKIFLTASAEKRAERRCAELKEKGQDAALSQVLADMAKRDALDAARAVAPLRQAEDAVLVDTSSLTLEESIQAVLRIIRKAQQV